MDILKKEIIALQYMIQEACIDPYRARVLLEQLERIRDAAMRVDCPDNDW